MDGPEIADGRVFFLSSRGDGYVLHAVRPGHTRRVIGRGREPGKALWRRYSFSAAPGQFAVQGSLIGEGGDSGTSDPSAGVTDYYHRSRTLAGPRPSGLAFAGRCSGIGEGFPFTLSSMFLVYPAHCPGDDLDDAGTKRLGVVDLREGRSRRRTVGVEGLRFLDYSDELSAAGRWLAVAAAPSYEREPGDPTETEDGSPIDYSGSDSEKATTVVLDLASGRVAYQAPQADTSDSYGAAVDQHGRLFNVHGDSERCRGQLAIYTIRRPTGRPLSRQACSPVLAAEQGTVIYEGKVGKQRALMAGGVLGEEPRAIALVGRLGVLRGFDVSGHQVTYGLATCGTDTAIRLTSLDTKDAGRPVQSACSAEVAPGRGPVLRRRAVSVPLRCPRGCRGVAVLRRLATRPKKPERLSSTSFETDERRERLWFRISRRQRSLLSARDQVRLDLYVEDRGGGTDRTVRRRLSLEAP